MNNTLEIASSIIGGTNPENFILPQGMKCFIVPPPNGKNSITYILNSYRGDNFYLGMKYFESDFIEYKEFNSSCIDDAFNSLELYQEGILTSGNFSFISYIEYWEDISVIFLQLPINDIINRKMEIFSTGWKYYLENILQMSNANNSFIKNLLALPCSA